MATKNNSNSTHECQFLLNSEISVCDISKKTNPGKMCKTQDIYQLVAPDNLDKPQDEFSDSVLNDCEPNREKSEISNIINDNIKDVLDNVNPENLFQSTLHDLSISSDESVTNNEFDYKTDCILNDTGHYQPKQKIKKRKLSSMIKKQKSQQTRIVLDTQISKPVVVPAVEIPKYLEQKTIHNNTEILYCYCKRPYDGISSMIACDRPHCQVEWYHFDCVGIVRAPKGNWYCPDCR